VTVRQPDYGPQILSDLRALRGLLEAPEHWTQGADARNANGITTFTKDREACSWCLTGAAYRVTMGEGSYLFNNQRFQRLVAALIDTLGTSGDAPLVSNCLLVIKFNDVRGRTHGEVLDLIDRTIGEWEACDGH
jgi:hypothetical protein